MPEITNLHLQGGNLNHCDRTPTKFMGNPYLEKNYQGIK